MSRPTRTARFGALAALCVALLAPGCGRSEASALDETAAAPFAEAPRQGTHIVAPTGPPRVATGLEDALGHDVTIACSTCHSVKAANQETRSGEQLTQFHQGLVTAHGGLTCLSCHDSLDYDRLRLADMTPVEHSEVMTLCRQCHGPQARDYDHGSHGGMTGYWDKSRGPRTRNGCTVCHDPHAPAFPTLTPARGPNDRFTPTEEGHGHD